MRVLLIEDDVSVLGALSFALERENIRCDKAHTGAEGLDMAANDQYDAIILDLMLPDINGHKLVKRLRDAENHTPVLILSGLTDSVEKVKGLGVGADDYITKPFDKDELVARINAIVRRSKGHAQSVIRVGRLTVNLDERCASVDDRVVNLTGKEYAILELLAIRKGSTLNKEFFLSHLYNGVAEPEMKIVDVFVCKLRKKLMQAGLDEAYIDTVWGRGYVLREPSQEDLSAPVVMAAPGSGTRVA